MRNGSTSTRDSRGRPPKASTVPPGRTSSSACCQACDGARGLDHDVGSCAGARLGPEGGSERASLRPRADADRPPAGVGDARAEHEPDRAEADHGDRVPGLDVGRVDAVQTAGERLDHRRELRRHPCRHLQEVRPRDPLGHEQELGIRAVEQREEVLTERLLPSFAGLARPAGGRVGGDDPSPGGDVDAAELVPEGARRRPEQHRMPASEGLEVGAVGERDLDLDEHVPLGLRLRPRHLLEPQVAGPVKDERPHPASEQ